MLMIHQIAFFLTLPRLATPLSMLREEFTIRGNFGEDARVKLAKEFCEGGGVGYGE